VRIAPHETRQRRGNAIRAKIAKRFNHKPIIVPQIILSTKDAIVTPILFSI